MQQPISQLTIRIPYNRRTLEEPELSDVDQKKQFTHAMSFRENKLEAFAIFKNLADKYNDSNAQNEVAKIYYKGEGVEKDEEKAIQYFKVAAVNGHARAQSNLGVMYLEIQNYDQAFFWFKESANQGNVLGQYNVAVMYSKGWGVPRNDLETARWLRRAYDKTRAQEQQTYLSPTYSAWYNTVREKIIKQQHSTLRKTKYGS